MFQPIKTTIHEGLKCFVLTNVLTMIQLNES